MEMLIGVAVVVVIALVLLLPVVVLTRMSAMKGELERLWQETQSLRVQCAELERRWARKGGASEPNAPPVPPEVTEDVQAAMAGEQGVLKTPGVESQKKREAGPIPAFVHETVHEKRSEPPPLPRSESVPPRRHPVVNPVPGRVEREKDRFDWERFMGVKLVAWLGGLALFLAAAYFVKYSFEHDLISPQARVVMGFLLGLGLIGGGWATKRKAFVVTSQTLCATGVVILYAVTYACRSVYGFPAFTPGVTFGLMVLLTAGAFGLALSMEAPVVAVLGMLAGFLTPAIVSTGRDNPGALFGYVALLNVGLMAVAGCRPWRYLIPLAAVGTILTELGWALKFLTPEKLPVALVIHAVFPALFWAGAEWKRRRSGADDWWEASTLMVGMAGMLQAFLCLPSPGYAERLMWLGGVLLVADVVVLLQLLRRPEWWFGQLISGGAAYLWMSLWMNHSLLPENLNEALGMIFMISALHCGHAAWFMRRHPQSPMRTGVHVFAPAALALVLIPVLKFSDLQLWIWPLILLVDALAVGLAVMTGVVWAVLVVLVMTALVATCWIFGIPLETGSVPWVMVVVGGMAVGFLFGSLLVMRRLGPREEGRRRMNVDSRDAAWLEQLPALSALMPFLLLIMVVARLPLPHPTGVFGLAMALLILLFSVARTFRQHGLWLVGLVGVLGLEWVWLRRHWTMGLNSVDALCWLSAFATVVFVFPFFSRESSRGAVLPWAVSALSFPLHFGLMYRIVERIWPNDFMGLFPAVLSLPLLGATLFLARSLGVEEKERLGVLAWMGGAALFFITLIFPIQFERQWITVSWALEGVALCWLFHRIPHPGLRLVGVGLLVVAFARLTFNTAVLSYHPRSETPILNWYLYAYGITIVSLVVAARLLAPPRDRWREFRFPRLLSVLATVLGFVLLNVEIADYFTLPGQAVLTFQFSGNLARDMTYTMAWALFALGLVFYGLRRPLRGARRAGLVLMGITLVKLFFHDLAQLAQLYRIGALAGVAVIAILASFLYQRFLVEENGKDGTETERRDPSQGL